MRTIGLGGDLICLGASYAQVVEKPEKPEKPEKTEKKTVEVPRTLLAMSIYAQVFSC